MVPPTTSLHINHAQHNTPALFKLAQVLQYVDFCIVVQIGPSLERAVKLTRQLRKQLRFITLPQRYCSHTGVIRHHQSRHAVGRFHVRAWLRQGDLNTCGTPRHEAMHVLLANALQTLVHLHRVHQALHDVHNGNVTPCSGIDAYHHILVLKQAAHHVAYRCLPHRCDLW